MDLGLAGSRVLVTGGSRGIGAAIAEAFVAEGCHVTICARSADALEETRQRLGPDRVQAVAADVRDADAVRALVLGERTFERGMRAGEVARRGG